MASHETVTVGPGERINPTVNSGETLSNVLYDITADGADVMISTNGTGWEVRNVGIRGRYNVGDDDLGAPGTGSGFNKVLDINGEGVLDTVYLGDGAAEGAQKSLMIIGPGDLGGGHVQINRMYGAEFSENANYVAGYAGEAQGGQGGSVEFKNCHMRDNNVAHFRCSGNLTLRNVTITNTNMVPPLYTTHGDVSHVINSRGIRADYNSLYGPVEAYNCDIDVTTSNTCNPRHGRQVNHCAASAVSIDQNGQPGQVKLYDCEVRGSISGGVEENNVGSNPDTSVPAGVPTSAKQAATGDVSGGNGDNGDTSPGYDHLLELSTGISGSTYMFTVDGDVTRGPKAEQNNDTIEDLGDGRYRVSGETGNNFADNYRFSGRITEISSNDGIENWTLKLDGQEVTRQELLDMTDDRGSGDDDTNGDTGGDTEPGGPSSIDSEPLVVFSMLSLGAAIKKATNDD